MFFKIGFPLSQRRSTLGRYVPYLLADTLQRSGNWGIVRVLPNDSSPIDVAINGTVLHSDGESMALRIDVSDSLGRAWYSKEYDEVVSRFSYEPAERQKNDPFQVVWRLRSSCAPNPPGSGASRLGYSR